MGTKEKTNKIKNCFFCGQETTKPKFCSHKCKLKDYKKRFYESRDKGCLICNSPVQKISLFCSKECQDKGRPPRKKPDRTCLQCGVETFNESFCSIKCKNKSMTFDRIMVNCKFCNVEFETESTNPKDFCSYECKERKYEINEEYFDGELCGEKLETLGQIISVGQIHNPTTIICKSDISTLTDISNKLKSTYPLIKQKELYALKIASQTFVNKLIDLGLSNNKLKQEFPPFDIQNGLFKTHRFKKIGGGWNVYRSLSEKLIQELNYRYGGKIITKTYYTNITQEELGVEFFLIWNDDKSKHDEL